LNISIVTTLTLYAHIPYQVNVRRTDNQDTSSQNNLQIKATYMIGH